MSDWEMSPEEYVEERDLWIEEYGIGWGAEDTSYTYDELTPEQLKEIKELDKQKLIWTNHSTCDDEYFTAGFWEFDGESGCGCWNTYSVYVAKKPWETENERIASTAYLPCGVCNEDGEGEGEEGCEGPEFPETPYGASHDGCDSGFVNWFFD